MGHSTLRKVIVVGIAVAAVTVRSEISDLAAIGAAKQEVRIERNKVRIGMTINDLLPLVHGMDIYASADGAWLSVLSNNNAFTILAALLKHGNTPTVLLPFRATAGRRKYHGIRDQPSPRQPHS